MKVDWINSVLQDEFARVTFIGYDAKGRRRPVVDLDSGNFVTLILLARSFRRHQRALQQRHKQRADDITQAGVVEQ